MKLFNKKLLLIIPLVFIIFLLFSNQSVKQTSAQACDACQTTAWNTCQDYIPATCSQWNPQTCQDYIPATCSQWNPTTCWNCWAAGCDEFGCWDAGCYSYDCSYTSYYDCSFWGSPYDCSYTSYYDCSFWGSPYSCNPYCVGSPCPACPPPGTCTDGPLGNYNTCSGTCQSTTYNRSVDSCGNCAYSGPLSTQTDTGCNCPNPHYCGDLFCDNGQNIWGYAETQYTCPGDCGIISGYQKCNPTPLTCPSGGTYDTYCTPLCPPNATSCYDTPSCTQPVACTSTSCPASGGGCMNSPGCPGTPMCGAGGNCYTDCNTCPTPTHLTCQNNTCASVSGAGINTCTGNQDCQPPGASGTHLQCQGNTCVSVAGGGASSCASNIDCSSAPVPPTAPTITDTITGANITNITDSSCVNTITYSGSEATISWTNPPILVSWVDISSDGFVTWYHKYVYGSTSTTAPTGFTLNGGTASFVANAGTTYSVRLWNGSMSPSSTFNIPACSIPAAPTGLSASCPAPGDTASLSWNSVAGATYYNVSYDALSQNNIAGTGTTISGLAPGSSHTWGVKACNGAGCSALTTGTNFTCVLPPCPPSAGYPAGGLGSCGSTPQAGLPDPRTIGVCSGTWAYNPGPSLAYNIWCAANANPTRGYCYQCNTNITPWIQATGDVHSNERINAPGGP